MIALLQRHKRHIINALVAANYLFPLFVILWAHEVEGTRWMRIFASFDRERTPIAWFSSVQLLLIALVAYGTYVATRAHDLRRGARSPYRWVWPVLALGFLVLAGDEYFMFHEQLRERVMKPNELFTDVPGFNPGDVGLFIPLLVGIGTSYFIVQALRPNRASVILFAAALAVITPLVIFDAFHIDVIWQDRTRRILYNMMEEIGENVAELLFLLSFLLVFFDRLLALAAPEGEGTEEAPGAEESAPG